MGQHMLVWDLYGSPGGPSRLQSGGVFVCCDDWGVAVVVSDSICGVHRHGSSFVGSIAWTFWGVVASVNRQAPVSPVVSGVDEHLCPGGSIQSVNWHWVGSGFGWTDGCLTVDFLWHHWFPCLTGGGSGPCH
jgi:hypothetical protein